MYTRPSPYTTGVAPSDAKSAWLAALPVAITRAPRKRANCTATLPTTPAPPWTSSISPRCTASASSTRVAVSPATASEAASSHESPLGFLATTEATASSA